MAMRIGTFWKQEDVKTYKLYEGDVSFDTGYCTENHKRVDILKFSSEILDSTFLAQSAHAAMEMDKATNNANKYATHYNPYEPECQAGFRLENTGTTVTYGNYKRRIAGCAEFKVGKEYWLPLSPTNAEIKEGDFLIIQSDSRTLDKMEVTKDTSDDVKVLVSMEDVPANCGLDNEGAFRQIYCYTLGSNMIPVVSA